VGLTLERAEAAWLGGMEAPGTGWWPRPDHDRFRAVPGGLGTRATLVLIATGAHWRASSRSSWEVTAAGALGQC